MIFGESDNDRFRRERKTSRKFAFLPTMLDNGRMAWLQHVYRKKVFSGLQCGYKWCYFATEEECRNAYRD